MPQPTPTPSDADYMAQAIRLAARGRYTTSPNPNVGCVLVRNGEVIGTGWHQRTGEPHAEINALAAAGGDARGATAYVSLEPCSHTGRTPPCTDALLDADIRRVVCAMQDPNPAVAGNGLRRLREAGVEVSCGLLETDAQALNPGFIKRMTKARPYVRVKLAMSLDGRTAMANGESQWITGSAARRDVQHLRARSSAIVTGIGTVLADDPSLTVRAAQIGTTPPPGGWRAPLRVVLDPELDCPSTARVLGDAAETRIFTTAAAVKSSGKLTTKAANVITCAAAPGGLDLDDVLARLAALQVNDVLVEAGAGLAGAFVQAGLADELVIYAAAKLMGHEARGLLRLPGLEHMADSLQLSYTDVRLVGEDLRLTLKL